MRSNPDAPRWLFWFYIIGIAVLLALLIGSILLGL